MTIFISHSSHDKDYGKLIVDLLIKCGIQHNQITFTSDDAYSIPTGKNIFNWLKSQLTQKPHVVYLLSYNYYSSVACLNEMGAAWVIENDHTAIFLPGFSPSDEKFQNGAIDPREMGLRIDNEDRIIEFIEQITKSSSIELNTKLLHRNVRQFMSNLSKIEPSGNDELLIDKEETEGQESILDSMLYWIENEKLRDEELLLLAFIQDESKFEFETSWREEYDIAAIRNWQDEYEIDDTLHTLFNKAKSRLIAREILYRTGKIIKVNEEIVQMLLNEEEFLQVELDFVKENYQI